MRRRRNCRSFWESLDMSPKGRYGAALDDLPQDWRTVQIAQLGKVISGGTPSREVPAYWGGDIPWLTPGELTSLKSKNIEQTNESITEQGLNGSGANLLPAGSLLITTRATLGARAINAVPMATNQGFKSIVFQNPKVADYYYYWAEKLESELIRRASGTTFLEVSGSQFCQISVPYPPEREQERIAQILDTLDTQIRDTEALIAKLERIKQGLLTDLLTRGIDQNGQLRPTPDQAPHLYKDSSLGLIPRKWQVLPFLEVAKLPSGQVSPLASEYREMPLVAPDHIESRTGKLIRIETAHEQGAISGKYLFEPGDIIYSKIRPYLRKAWLADIRGLCSADMYPLRPRSGISSMFLFTLVMSEHFSEFANAVSMRTGIPKINRKELASLEFAVPCSLEQAGIENTLTSIDQRIQGERKQLVKLSNKKQGLMDDLLTGRVRVTPLLEDEVQATA